MRTIAKSVYTSDGEKKEKKNRKKISNGNQAIQPHQTAKGKIPDSFK